MGTLLDRPPHKHSCRVEYSKIYPVPISCDVQRCDEASGEYQPRHEGGHVCTGGDTVGRDIGSCIPSRNVSRGLGEPP